MAFYMILTEIGKAKLANATALGNTVALAEVAVGDGGGSAVTPQDTDTELVNEVWRAALNGVSIDPDNANWIVSEGYIPADTGGFTVREVALFDDTGDMIAVGNYPDTYKPTLASGSAKDLYVKIIIEVSDASAVTLKIDPSVVLSTRGYVDEVAATKADKTHNHDTVYAKLGGLATQKFLVATATLANEAINKSQMESALSGIDLTSFLSINNLLHIQDQKPAGTSGGSAVSGWQTRDINTVVTNNITGASLDAVNKKFTLPVGIYYFDIKAPAAQVLTHRIHLKNQTDTVDVLKGRNAYGYSTYPTMEDASLTGILTITSAKEFSIEHNCGISAAQGLGYLGTHSYTDIEIYTDVKIWKVG